MNITDKVVGFFNPGKAIKRMQTREEMKSLQRRFEGAANGRRQSNWMMRNNPSINQLVGRDLKNLVSRSRELTINNSYAKKAPTTIANNCIGTGIIAKPYIVEQVKDGKIVKLSKSKKDELTAVVSAAWKEWADELSCDYNEDHNFSGIQYLTIRSFVISGELLIVRKRVKSDVNKYGLQLLLLEGDYIDQTKNNNFDLDGGFTSNGIKYDKDSKRVGYWIYTTHPSEGHGRLSNLSTLVPMKDIIHLYDVERPGQNRGVPLPSSTILKQRDLDDYEDAELVGKKTAACMPVFVTNSDPEAKLKDGEDRIETLEPGQINYLQGNESVTFATPPTNNGFAEFTKTQHRSVAAGYFLTYEQYSGDLSNVNFSSGRMGWLDFNRMVQYWQYTMFIPKVCEKVFTWFVEAMRTAHGITDNVTIKATWTPPRREMIDPLKEGAAKRIQLRSGLLSWQEMVRQDGYDPDEVLKEMKADQAAMISAGLTPDYTPYFELKAKLELINANSKANASATP